MLKDNGNLPNSNKTAIFVVLECTPNMDLQNLRCNTYLMQSVSFRDPMGCMYIAGADQEFQVRGGGAHLKKLRHSWIRPCIVYIAWLLLAFINVN